jgi:hypothetical protein
MTEYAHPYPKKATAVNALMRKGAFVAPFVGN